MAENAKKLIEDSTNPSIVQIRSLPIKELITESMKNEIVENALNSVDLLG
jgi:hypothetical protein